MKITDMQGAGIGVGALIVGLITLAIPFMLYVWGIAFVIVGTYFIGQNIEFEQEKKGKKNELPRLKSQGISAQLKK